MMRGALAAKVYSKVNEKSIMDVDDSTALTLMSADVERVTNGLNLIHETWAGVIEVVVGIYLLHLQIGLSALVALGIALSRSPSTPTIYRHANYLHIMQPAPLLRFCLGQLLATVRSHGWRR